MFGYDILSYKDYEARCERTVLHADLNNFFASVEERRNPDLRHYPVAVCGSKEDRHGIVLAKNQKAKAFGVTTGETIGEARGKCRELVVINPHYGDYLDYSRRVREIYSDYTDRIESFGVDECWLDVSGSLSLFGSGTDIANTMRERVKRELGVTISVGVSFNKSFAKLGSDMKKPDAVTEIPRDSFREKVWGLPASDLLGVGRKVRRKLWFSGIKTIGDIARTPPEYIESAFGKCGYSLWLCANGLDFSPVAHMDAAPPMKSVGHGTTGREDIREPDTAERVIIALCGEIGARLRSASLAANTVTVAVRDCELRVCEYARRTPRPTQSERAIAAEAFSLLIANYLWEKPIRSLTVRASNLTPADAPQQMDIFELPDAQTRAGELFAACDAVREKYGEHILIPARTVGERIMPKLDVVSTLPGSIGQ